MLPIIIIVCSIIVLLIAYVTYGSWLAKKWGIDPSRKTPAVEHEDGVDYVPAKPVVLLGHHFSSIAGAGPINGPIQAAVFGWVPVLLWCLIGSVFFGGVHDFGALFASVRHDGKSIGDVIGDSMGSRAKKLFCVFALVVLLLVVASFVNVVAGTFYSTDVTGFFTTNPTGNQTTSMVSLLFIIIAIIYGLLTNRAGLKTIPATIIGIILIAGAVVLGLNVGIAMTRTVWIVVIGVYIAVASLVPVWILLQPRDYLSSFLLYGMMALALVGIFVAAIAGTASFSIPAFTGFNTSLGTLFPALFITVACGACSGFHSLVSSGTTSKQLSSEKNMKAIGYGSMLIEGGLAVVALIAVGMVWANYQNGDYGSPSAAFAAGIATMFGDSATTVYAVIYALITLAVSVFALTSLDTGTRLSRFIFTELFLKEGEASWKEAKGIRKVLACPIVGTLFMVVVGCILGGLSLSDIWSLFGAANQLLAGIALMAVAAWLGEIGKGKKMVILPMIFMLLATLTYLVITVVKMIIRFSTGAMDGDVLYIAEWGKWFQLVFAVALIVLAIILIIQGIQTFSKQSKQSKAAA